MDHFQARRARLNKRNFLHGVFGTTESATQASVLNSMICTYASLPYCFKKTRSITFNSTEDRFGFQAANIAATVQLLRMVLFSASGATIEQKCQVASEDVAAFALVNTNRLSPSHQPTSSLPRRWIGSILGFVLEEPLSTSKYAQVRNVLLSMAQPLSTVDSAVNAPTDTNECLRSLVNKIDKYMEIEGGRTFRNLTLNRHTEALQAGPQDPGRDRFINMSNNSDGTVNDNNNNLPSLATSTAPTASSNMNYQLSPELLDGWSWAFDSAQPFHN